MKRSRLALLIGALPLVTACPDDASQDPSVGSSSDDGGEQDTGTTQATSQTTTLSTSADTTDGETTVVDPTDDTDVGETTAASTSSSDDSGSSDTGDLCGNDVIDDGEVCDGTDLGGADCVSAGFDGGTLECWSSCDSLNTSACTMADCGNGIVEAGELCDGADLGGADCVAQGFDGGTLGCSPSCQLYNLSACTACGDNDQDPGEACDTNDFGDETCTTQGFQAGTLDCADDCTIVTTGCNNDPPCADEDIGSAVGQVVASGSTIGEDDDLAQACAGGGALDHVMIWVAPADGSYRFDTVGSGYDTALAIYTDCNSAELACNDNISGGEPDSRIVADVAIGDLLLISVSGSFGATGNWVLNINLDGPGGPCCSAHGSSGCDDDVGCEDTVCALDASCCNVAESWDAGCVAVAAANCAPCIGVCGNGLVDDDDEVCDGDNLDGETCLSQGFAFGTLGCAPDCTFETASCGNYDGDCCSAHVSPDPGCEDGNCTAFICGNDGFCCNTNWDGICASAATTGCAVCNPDVCGNNTVDGIGEVCDGVDLGGEDCATQGFDSGALSCAGDCTGYDTSACFDDGEDCCLAWGGAGCSDVTCNDAVCGGDAFCCDTTWDTICANEAAGVCTVCGGGEGDCCTETGDIGCVDNFCVAQICGFGGLDTTCCSASWTAACTALASANCDVCM
jgi:hypothetical protein